MKPTIKGAIDATEKSFLILIAGFTVVAMVQEILTLIANRKVELKDLLLMFIYAEVLGMLGAFYTRQKILITHTAVHRHDSVGAADHPARQRGRPGGADL